jgi:hypothetical protein
MEDGLWLGMESGLWWWKLEKDGGYYNWFMIVKAGEKHIQLPNPITYDHLF